jgi:hypothetical protein
MSDKTGEKQSRQIVGQIAFFGTEGSSVNWRECYFALMERGFWDKVGADWWGDGSLSMLDGRRCGRREVDDDSNDVENG